MNGPAEMWKRFIQLLNVHQRLNHFLKIALGVELSSKSSVLIFPG